MLRITLLALVFGFGGLTAANAQAPSAAWPTPRVTEVPPGAKFGNPNQPRVEEAPAGLRWDNPRQPRVREVPPGTQFGHPHQFRVEEVPPGRVWR